MGALFSRASLAVSLVGRRPLKKGRKNRVDLGAECFRVVLERQRVLCFLTEEELLEVWSFICPLALKAVKVELEDRLWDLHPVLLRVYEGSVRWCRVEIFRRDVETAERSGAPLANMVHEPWGHFQVLCEAYDSSRIGPQFSGLGFFRVEVSAMAPHMGGLKCTVRDGDGWSRFAPFKNAWIVPLPSNVVGDFDPSSVLPDITVADALSNYLKDGAALGARIVLRHTLSDKMTTIIDPIEPPSKVGWLPGKFVYFSFSNLL